MALVILACEDGIAEFSKFLSPQFIKTKGTRVTYPFILFLIFHTGVSGVTGMGLFHVLKIQKYNVVTIKALEKQTTKFSFANFHEMFRKSLIVLRIQRLEEKQYRFRRDGS